MSLSNYNSGVRMPYSSSHLASTILDMRFEEDYDPLTRQVTMIMRVEVPYTDKVYKLGCILPEDMSEHERHTRFTETCREAMIGMFTLGDNRNGKE